MALSVGLAPFNPAKSDSMAQTLKDIAGRGLAAGFMHGAMWPKVCSGQSIAEAYAPQSWLAALPGMGIDLLYALDFTESDNRSRLNRPTDCALGAADFRFANPVLRTALIEEALYVLENLSPKYLAVGVEVEEYFAAKPGEVSAYRELFNELYAEAKKRRPQTTVFLYLQYENTAKKQNRWSVVNNVLSGLSLDAVGFSSYPQLLTGTISKGSDMPDDYFDSISENLTIDKPLIFAELGASVVKSAIYDPGTDPGSDQALFIRRFFSAISGLNVALVNWTYYHDFNFVSDCSADCRCTPRHIFSSTQAALFFSGLGLLPDECGPGKGVANRGALDVFLSALQ